MNGLIEEFSSRVVDTRSHKKDFKLFGTPFDIEVDEVSEQVQMELIELQNNDLLKASFNELMRSKLRSKDSLLLEFYQKYLMDEAETYPNLLDHAKKMASIFGSTYVCEQLFSKMKFTKNKLRTQLTDSHLDGILRMASSSLEPNIELLSKEKQHQPSH